MKLKTCFADVLMFIVAKTKIIDTLKISKFLLISFFCVFKVFQCTALGAALDNCLCFSFARRVSYPPTQLLLLMFVYDMVLVQCKQ